MTVLLKELQALSASVSTLLIVFESGEAYDNYEAQVAQQ